MSSAKGGTNATKDVIYIDVDDEITGIIDKVKGSEKKIVALVLPKRATVLQSIVNMKLLKRTTDQSKKNLVLITAEAGLLPLAGSVGIHVAKSLNSKPEVPDAPAAAAPKVAEAVEDAGAAEDESELDQTRTVGELSDETIELDNDEEEAVAPGPEGKTKPAKNRKFKIPNFNKFRLLLLLGGVGLILLGGFTYAAVAVLPKAKVTIKTDSTSVNADVVLALKTGKDVKLDVAKSTVPAQSQEVKKTLEEEVPATGKLNKGEKAEGSVVMTAKDCTAPYDAPNDISAGSGVSTGGNTYITQKKANFGLDDVSGGCVYFKSGSVDIEAQTGGSKFNVSGATFTVPGHSSVTASGSASGGTDEVVTVVTQADVDNAKQKIAEEDTDEIKQELKSALIAKGLYAVDATFAMRETDTKLNAKLNDEVDKITVTQTISYTMLGVMQDDLKQILDKAVEGKIDTSKQNISDYGLDEAEFSLQEAQKDGAAVGLRTTVVAGAELNTETIKQQIAGKKAGDAQRIISANPGVTDVQVEYSPFWVSSIPKKTDKITIVIQEPEATKDDQPASP